MSTINTKRIYKPADESDGFRILVDRLWPRGISKETARLNLWLKEIAPSTDLRKSFHSSNAPDKWDKFKTAYLAELKQNEAVNELAALIKNRSTVTLLYAVPDEAHNHAVLLKEFMGL